MPSTVVHVALAGLLGTALLADEFDARAIGVVMAVAVLPDLDTFLGLWLPGTHRAALHTFLFPALLGGLLLADVRLRERSLVRARWGARGVRIAWVSIVTMVLAAIGPDLFLNGVNLLYPLHDRFYELNGRVFLSNQRGFVQTLVEFERERPKSTPSTTKNTHYSTGVDPTPGEERADVERIFPIAWNGIRFLLVVVGFATVSFRLWEERRRT